MSLRNLKAKLTTLHAEPDAALREERDAWISAVSALFGAIESWLEPLSDQVRLLRTTHRHHEQELGGYEIEHLTLLIDGVAGEFVFVPISPQVVGIRSADGRFLSGVSGRVSLKYGAEDIPIVRLTGREGWWFSTSAHPELQGLTEDAFTDFLATLIDG